MPHIPRILRAFCCARPLEYGPYDTLTRLPPLTAHAGESEPGQALRTPALEPPMDEDEITLRVWLLLRTGEFSGPAVPS